MADGRDPQPNPDLTETDTGGSPSNAHPEKPLGVVERCTAGCFSIVLGVFSGWLIWMVRTFLDGDSWIEDVVRQILDDLALAVGLFALTFLVWVVLRPPWLGRLFAWSYDHLLKAFVVFLLVLLLPAFLFALWGGFQTLCK